MDAILPLLILFNASPIKSSYSYILTFLALIASNYEALLTALEQLWHLFTKHVNIELSYSITNSSGHCYVKASPRAKALVHYMHKHAHESHGVKTMSEVFTNTFFQYEDSQTEIAYQQSSQFIINQLNKVKLNNKSNIYVSVRIKEITHHKESLHSNTVIKITLEGNTVLDIQKFIQDCETEYEFDMNEIVNKQLHIFQLKSVDTDSQQNTYIEIPFKSNKTFSNIVFTNKQEVISRIDYFINNKAMYDKVGIPYTLGMLFQGPPGTSKTSTIKSIANYMKRHIVIIPTHLITTYEELIQVFSSDNFNDKHIPMEKRIYVFEEIDCGSWADIIRSRSISTPQEASPSNTKKDDHHDVLTKILLEASTSDQETTKSKKRHGGNKHLSKQPLTLANILESLDGIIEYTGRVIIFTSNHPEVLDKALLRPGRIDMQVEFKKLSKEEIADVYKMWYDKQIPEELLNTFTGNQFTLAELSEALRFK